jgi:hypothetical protein
MRCPMDKVSGEEYSAFLKIDSWLGAHLDLMQVENLFAFFDPSFDDLPAVIVIEPKGGSCVTGSVPKWSKVECLSVEPV